MVRGAVGAASPSPPPPDTVRTEETGCSLCVFSLGGLHIHLLSVLRLTEVRFHHRDRDGGKRQKGSCFCERGKDNSLRITK